MKSLSSGWCNRQISMSCAACRDFAMRFLELGETAEVLEEVSQDGITTQDQLSFREAQ